MTSDVPILLIEGNPSDIEDIKNALKATEVKCPVNYMSTCEEALVYLNNKNNLQPWLIILGLNEQKSDSLNFLKTIKADDNLRQIPVVIFSFSNEQEYVVKSFKLGVAGYIVKPENISELTEKIKTMIQYWTLSELPPNHNKYCEDSNYYS